MEQVFSILTDDKVRLDSLVVGNEEAQQLIIFLHGGPGSGYRPLREIEAFLQLEKDYLCLYFDQRGAGNSYFPATEKFSKERLIADVLEVIHFAKKLFAKKEIWLFGGSFGGNLALQTIKAAPTCVKGLLLSCPAVFFSKAEGRAFFKKGQQQYMNRLFAEEKQRFAQMLELSPQDFFAQPAIREYILSEENQSKSLHYTYQMSDWFFDADLAGVFDSVQIPLCIIQGVLDSICSQEKLSAQLVKEQNSLIDYHALADCGHGPFSEAPDTFLQIYNTFIKEHTSC
ncbi:alpha/beta fold hydrolase [Enterococcus sp. HY326]|uniref:alpha/beta fold hydrolase n=1 Tax=Enterococcus sp. HY326 TaxID=2971265 RepID=UPI00223F8DA4|nr:alpha/beta hydrolase [Enterococcus sp. HY326]